MADTKITALNAITLPAAADIFLGVDDPAGSAETKKITHDDLLFGADGTPSTQAHGDSAAKGTALDSARSDHKHAMPGAGAGKGTLFIPIHNGAGSGFTLATRKSAYGCAASSGQTDDRFNVTFTMPSDFSSVSKFVVIIISDDTGDLRHSALSEFSADGEDYQANTDSIAAATRAMTANQMDEIDLTAALTGLAADDHVGMQFDRVGTNAADTIVTLNVLGFYLEWSI